MSERRNYWVALDGLRGVAVALVILYHFGAPIGSGGYLGVDLFFVISGCVVTAALRRSMAQGDTLAEFFLRRVARLLPNLLLLLLAVLVWNTWDEGTFFTTRNAAVLAGLTQTYNIFTASNGIATLHLWSLSMEWQFYLLLPMLLPVFCVRGLSSGVRWAVCMAVLSIVLRPILEFVFGASPIHIYLWPITRLDDLMLGVTVALLVAQGRYLSSPWLAATAVWGLVGALLFAPRWFRSPDASLFVVMPLVAVAGFIVVWSAASSGPGRY